MKIKYILGAGLVALLLLFNSCEKDLPQYEGYSPYLYSKVDSAGGNWDPILVENSSSLVIDAPTDISSAEYQAELAEIKNLSGNISDTQRDQIHYWTNNPVLRWNEVALELAAKYNLIPPPNEDGTYTLPTPANPNGPPVFPFAHPPYTSRMLSYLSVAQFDGLITAWNYKFQFNRPSPYTVDNTIPNSYVNNNLPSYPSDGAVIASVSQKILSAMFPLEKDYIDGLVKDHLACLKLSGTNVESDIAAGISIGEQISALALARASQDGMSSAQTPKPISDSIKTEAQNRFGWAWDNMEDPVRPVGLVPNFGKVRMWNVPNVEAIRPGVPPSIGSAEFNEAAEELKSFAKNLTTEQRRIANWWEDGLGSYTPPGHWNNLAKKFCVEYKLNPLRTARVFAYMNMAIMDAGIGCWDAKFYYHYPRPIQTIPGFKTILGTPNFPAYTSGHSVFSAAAATVLAYIFPEKAQFCHDWAEEAAISRVYGGIHYRFDAEVGIEQGNQAGQYTVDVARQDGAE